MKQLSRGILIGVALFLVIVVGLLFARGRGVKSEPTETLAGGADYRIKEVHLREESDRGAKWQLDADYAEVYEEQGRTFMRNVKMSVEEPMRTWTVTGDEGDLSQATKDVELRGNVVLIRSDGLRLETARLRWRGDQQRAWTDDPVTLFQNGTVVHGQGLEVRLAEEATSIKGRVRATFAKPPPPGEPHPRQASAPKTKP